MLKHLAPSVANVAQVVREQQTTSSCPPASRLFGAVIVGDLGQQEE